LTHGRILSHFNNRCGGNRMAIAERGSTSLLADKGDLRRLMAEQNKLMGVTRDPTATGERAQAMSLALGIRPEENSLSCGIIEMRDEG